MIANIDVDDLLSRMTLEEKCAQLGGVWFSDLFTAGQFDEAKMQQLLGDGIGQVTRISGTGFAPADAAAAVDRIQRFLAEHTRLGIPALPHEEALAGLMGPGATNFPQAIGMAASWDPEIVEQAAAAAGSMQDQASRLSQQVRRFKVDAGGAPQARLIEAGRATPHPAVAAPRQDPVVTRPALSHAGEDDWSSF